MSGHNPHSHLSQPNSSWNPLQIPSYIPRQPQLAHMSNERPLVRSPLTWHSPAAPTPPEAFYNFLSANHKNLELNPLLPTFVRGPAPFGSVDLTIQTARNTTTPSPRNLASPPVSQEFATHNKSIQQQTSEQQSHYAAPHHQQHQIHHQSIPRSLTPNSVNSSNLPPSAGLGVIQSTGSVRDKFTCSTSNGNNGDISQLQPLPAASGSIFIRDARQINSGIVKAAARENVPMEVCSLPANEPVELTKENAYQSVKSHTSVPTSPKRLSPTRPPSTPNCTPLSPRPRSPSTTAINTGTVTDIVNNYFAKLTGNSLNLLSTQKPETTNIAMSSENSPLSLALPPSPTTTTSNEDSVDSQTGKSRRKRKPNKTTKVSNDSDGSLLGKENDMALSKQDSVSNEQSHTSFIPEKGETLIDLDTNKLISSNKNAPNEVINSNNLICQSDSRIQENDRDIEPRDPHKEKCEQSASAVVEVKLISDVEEINRSSESPSKELQEEKSSSVQRPRTPPEEPPSVIVNNVSASIVNKIELNSHDDADHSNAKTINSCHASETSSGCETTNANAPESEIPTDATELNTETNLLPLESTSSETLLDSPRKRSKRKGDSDDIETIDKIAAMIASTHTNEDDINDAAMSNVDNLEVLTNDIKDSFGKGDHTKIDDVELYKADTENSNSKISELAEILETPPVGTSPNKCIEDNNKPLEGVVNEQPKQNNVENCFKEVENKLEEMFAGIEDGEPPPCILAQPPIDEPITPEVISELGLEGISSPQKQRPATVSTSSEEEPAKPEQKEDYSTSKSTSSSHHNSSQKRSHTSSKSESNLPSKKQKVSKKSTQSSSSNQKPSTSSTSSSKPFKSHSSSTSTSNTSKAPKPNDKQQQPSSKEKVKEEQPTTVEYKGPFVHIKSDGTINVINAPVAEDVVEKQNKVKKSIHNHSHSDRSKIRGLHVSTLSTKYDADTTDTTWMCVFCKKGPHKLGLGDLFGPYIVTTTCDGFAYSQKDPNDDEFISKRKKADMIPRQINGMPAIPVAVSSVTSAASVNTNVTNTSNTSSSKKKRKINESPSLHQTTSASPTLLSPNADTNDIYLGMTKVSETSYEVWVHEDCVVWSSGVYLIGSRIVGLDTAVWSSTRYNCSVCSKNGAMICCFQRGCTEKAHMPCARMQNWDLDDDNYQSTCAKHTIASS